MKQRHIKTPQDRDNAIKAVMSLDFPYVMGIGEEKIRSSSANARYWATLNDYIDQLTAAVYQVAEYTGYTPLEARRIVAQKLMPEQGAILFATKAEAVHDMIKLICGVPTSTRLGTKKFQKFEAIMETTITEIVGEVNAIAGRILN